MSQCKKLQEREGRRKRRHFKNFLLSKTANAERFASQSQVQLVYRLDSQKTQSHFFLGGEHLWRQAAIMAADAKCNAKAARCRGKGDAMPKGQSIRGSCREYSEGQPVRRTLTLQTLKEKGNATTNWAIGSSRPASHGPSRSPSCRSPILGRDHHWSRSSGVLAPSSACGSPCRSALCQSAGSASPEGSLKNSRTGSRHMYCNARGSQSMKVTAHCNGPASFLGQHWPRELGYALVMDRQEELVAGQNAM